MFRTIRKKIFRLAFVSGVGAAASYFFDKDKGEERRAQAKERANGLMGKASGGGGSWQAETERSANNFEPTVVSSPAPAATPPVSTVPPSPGPADTITDTMPGTTASPTAPIPGA